MVFFADFVNHFFVQNLGVWGDRSINNVFCQIQIQHTRFPIKGINFGILPWQWWYFLLILSIIFFVQNLGVWGKLGIPSILFILTPRRYHTSCVIPHVLSYPIQKYISGYNRRFRKKYKFKGTEMLYFTHLPILQSVQGFHVYGVKICHSHWLGLLLLTQCRCYRAACDVP